MPSTKIGNVKLQTKGDPRAAITYNMKLMLINYRSYKSYLIQSLCSQKYARDYR